LKYTLIYGGRKEEKARDQRQEAGKRKERGKEEKERPWPVATL
jgi:hypothetical protein